MIAIYKNSPCLVLKAYIITCSNIGSTHKSFEYYILFGENKIFIYKDLNGKWLMVNGAINEKEYEEININAGLSARCIYPHR